MGRPRRSNVDWYGVFLEAFTHDGAIRASSDSGEQADDGEHYFRRLTRPAATDAEGPDVDAPSASEALGPDATSASKGLGPDEGVHHDFSLVDEDKQTEHESSKDYSKLPPKVSGEKKNNGKVAVGLRSDVPSVSEGLGLDGPSASKGVYDFSLVDEDNQGEHQSNKDRSKLPPKVSGEKKNNGKDAVSLGPDVPYASEDLGPDVPFASKGVNDFGPMDEDNQGEHQSSKDCLKLPREDSGEKKNNCNLPMKKNRSQSHGGKRKPSLDKRRAHAIDPKESDYGSSLPSRSSKRMKQQLQKLSSAFSRKVQDVILLDDEDMEPKEEVNREMSDRLNEQKIYYPSRDDQEAVELTRSDMKCLDTQVFLSSPVINFYIQYIKRATLCNENIRDKFYIFNTYFYGKLEEGFHQPGDFRKLRRWWKGVNIFNNAYIILPIHGREHWSLVIICLPPKERISEPIILHLDSLGMHRSARIFRTVERYLEQEWCFLSDTEAAWPCLLTDIRKETVQVPQQNNAYDCGIFMLYYIEQFIKEAPARFTTDKLDMFSHSWFKPEEASGLRQRIRDLLLQEFQCSRLLDDTIPEADACEGYDGIKDGKLEEHDRSKMVVEVGVVGLGNTVESDGGMKVAASQEASKESGDDVKVNGGIKDATSQEASEEFRGAGKSIERLKVAVSEKASGESRDAIKSTGGIKVTTSQEAIEEFLGAGMNIVGLKIAESEEASEESGGGVNSTGGIKATTSQEASVEFLGAGLNIVGMKVAELEEASEESGDAAKSTGGIKVASSREQADAEGLGPVAPSASKGLEPDKGLYDFSLVDEDKQGEHGSNKDCMKLPPEVSEERKNGKDAVDLGLDVPCVSEDLGSDVPYVSKDLGLDVPYVSEDLGPDVPSTSMGVYDLSPVDEDNQGEHQSSKDCSELPPKDSGEKKKNGKLHLKKNKSQGYGGKRKPSVNKWRAHAIDPKESDYGSSLPSISFKRRKQQLQNLVSAFSRKVQDVILLDDEDMEPKEEVNHEMSNRLNEQKIYYPSRDDQEAVELTRSDMKCLDPEVFLSSRVINFYIQYIKRTTLCNENFRDKFYIFNTYFYGKLEEGFHQRGHFPKLRRWWKGVNIFNNAYIILPIRGREHWSLVIICLPPKKRISEPIILHLDSLVGMHRSAKILGTVERYLKHEWCFLSDTEAAWPCLLTDIRKETVEVPQQNNAYDCGIFMLYYIEQFIKEAPARFTTDKLDMFSRSWFKPEEASGLRQRIRELQLQEFESPRLLDDAIPEADASEGYDGIKDGKLEAHDSSKMVVKVGVVELGNTAEGIRGMKVTTSQEASKESGDVFKCTGGIKDAASQEASEEFRGPGKSIERLKVAASEKASGMSGDAFKSTIGLVDEDKHGEHEISKDCTKLPPEVSEENKNGKLPLKKNKSQGHGGKWKPSMNKRKAHAIDPKESDYRNSLPSRSFKRRKQRLQNLISSFSQKVQDVIPLDDEAMEPKEEVNREMSGRLNEQNIYYPSRDDQEDVELTRSDLKCLDPEVFLSSSVINFYIQYIKRTTLCNENFRDKFYIFNTYFYGKLEEGFHQPGDFRKLRRWWKGVNIFNNAYIILPIRGREHWSLAIICLPPKKRISEPIILHLDSLGMHRSAKILRTVERYLEHEWCFLSDTEAAWPCLLTDIRKETVENNVYDCGIFMLYYIEQFIKEAPARFTIDKLDMFSRSWFKPEEASGLRQRIRGLLLQEFESSRLLDDAIPETDASEGYDGIKDGKLEAPDSSKMVVEVGVVELGNTVESIRGTKVAASQEASKESGDVVKCTGGIKDTALREASEEFRGAGKSIEGLKVAASGKASGESGDAIKSTGSIKVTASQEASEEFLSSGMNIVEMKVAESEASEESGNAVNSTGDVKVASSQEASEEFQNAGESTEGSNVAESEEASEVSSDAAKSVEGVYVVVSDDEASEEFEDTGKSKALASEVASTESGHPANKIMEDVSNVAVLNKGATSSINKWNEKKNTLRVLAESAAWSESVNDQKHTVKKADGSGSSSNAEKEAERLKGCTPAVPDAVSECGGAKRSEGIGSSSTPAVAVTPPDAAVCEASGTKVWITRVYRPTIAWPPGNWSRSSGGSSRDARRKFIE